MNLQIFMIAFSASIGGLLAGYDMGIISGALLFIKNDWNLDLALQGFLVSSAIIGCVIGALANGFLSDILGRKKIILWTGVIFFIGSILSAISPNYNILVLSRIVAGVAVGMATFVVPLYLSEISPKKYRGTFVSLFQLALTFGILFAYFINAIFAKSLYNWRLMLFVGIIPSCFLILSVFFLNDSPRWLILKGRYDEAKETLKATRQEDELEEIKKNSTKNPDFKFEKWIIYPLILGICIMFVQICTGINVIIYYAPTIFQFAGFEGETPALIATIGIGIVNFLMTFIAIFLSDKIGRKPLVYSGLFVMLISMLVLGFMFMMPDYSYSKIIIVLATLFYICAFSFSLGPVTYILTSELFPLKVRGFLMSASFGANFIFNFIVVLTFLPLLEKIGPTYTFWIFSGISFLSLLFYKFFIPETKGISLEEIEEGFKNKSIK